MTSLQRVRNQLVSASTSAAISAGAAASSPSRASAKRSPVTNARMTSGSNFDDATLSSSPLNVLSALQKRFDESSATKRTSAAGGDGAVPHVFSSYACWASWAFWNFGGGRSNSAPSAAVPSRSSRFTSKSYFSSNGVTSVRIPLTLIST